MHPGLFYALRDDQVATPEGVVRELPDTPYNESENGFRGSALSNGDAGKSAVPKAGLGEARPESGWVPSSSNGVEVRRFILIGPADSRCTVSLETQ